MQPPTVLVVDYGAQYAQLIARRVREAQVYSEIVPGSTSVGEIVARKPAAVILSGGPSSVYADGAPRIDPALFDAGIPVLGLCYGFQAMALALGGEVAPDGTYTTYAPRIGRTDAERNCISNIRPQGLPPQAAATTAHWLVRETLSRKVSGVALKDESGADIPSLRPSGRGDDLTIGASHEAWDRIQR